MHLFMHKKLIFVLLLLLLFSVNGFCDNRVKIKGYYHEDGTYVKQRVIDPIELDDDFMVPLSCELKKRREQISDFYKGRVVTTKVSFPASHKGNVVYIDNLGKSNIEIFTRVNKYGAGIEKESKAIITDFKIKSKVIDIELNNGGYGTFKDLCWRVAADICSLGLAELRDYKKVRYKHGSRLRIKLDKKDGTSIKECDLNFLNFKEALQKENNTNHIILKKLNMNMGENRLETLTEADALRALNKILLDTDFYKEIEINEADLSKKSKKLLKEAEKISNAGKKSFIKKWLLFGLFDKKPLKEKEIQRLNRALLHAVYPDAILKSRKKFCREDIDYERIDEYLSLVFQLNNKG